MQATVERNRETGEFSCVVGGKVLLTGKIASKIKRVHDMVDAINMGAVPEIHSEGRGDKRRFTVTLGEFVVASGMSAHGGYKVLDEMEEALPPVVEIRPEALAAIEREMSRVPVPNSAYDPEFPFGREDAGEP